MSGQGGGDTLQSRPTMVGARVRRTEDPRLLTGHGRFVDDRAVPGMLHVAFLRSDLPHARIVGIDCEQAGAMPGVVAILTGRDLADLPVLEATSRMRSYRATPVRALALDRVRYVGEPVAAVIADSRYRAEDARDLIAVDYEPLAAAIDPEQAVADGAPLLHDHAPGNILAERTFEKGEVEAAMAAAPVRVRHRFRFHRKAPLAIENRAYLAEYEAGRGAITLYSTTQVPGIIRDALSEVLDLPGHSLRVVAPDVGGGFGGKSSLFPEEILVCAAARRLGRTVKWTGDRMEDLLATSQSFDEIIEAELGLSEAGDILALSADVIGDVGAGSIYPWTAVIEPIQVVSFMPGPYRVEHYRGRVRAVTTPKAPTGPYRGVGRPPAAFAMERLIDMAARRLGQDPRELRRRNLVRPEEFPYKTGSGIVWDRSGFTECLEAACETAGYDDLRRRQAAARTEGRWFGIGLACYAELTGIGSRISAAPGMPINTGTETATIRIDSTGAVSVAVGVAAHGQGLETTLAQVVADQLGVRMRDIRIVHGDSDAVANATGTYASRSTVLAGGAVTRAALSVKEKVFAAAAHIMECDAGDLEAYDGTIAIAGTDRAMSFRELARAVYAEMGRLPADVREELAATESYDPVFGTTTAATHIATVEIDPETYAVTVKDYVVAEDCGRVINPLIVDGQVHGGVAQGIGAALHEEVVYDEQGQCLTASLVDYVVPAANEVPPMKVRHMELELPNTVGGFRGMGEGGTIGAPAAIANAVSDALAPLGLEIDTLPVTPERLFRLISGAAD